MVMDKELTAKQWEEEYLKCECIEKYKHINADTSAIAYFTKR